MFVQSSTPLTQTALPHMRGISTEIPLSNKTNSQVSWTRSDMKILLAEDEQKVALFLIGALRSAHHEVTHVTTSPEIIVALETETYDLAVLDRMLRGHDSLRHLPEVRRRWPELPILVLSALNSPEERVLALDQGADDYLGKPYSLAELLARIRAITRRVRPQMESGTPVLQVGDLTIDALSQSVSVGGKRVDLTHKEFQVLIQLSRSPGQVLNKYVLLDRVWDTQIELESNVVESTVRNLRRKLESAGAEIEIKNRRNSGYWLET